MHIHKNTLWTSSCARKHVAHERDARRAVLHADDDDVDGDLVLGGPAQIAEEKEPQEEYKKQFQDDFGGSGGT